MELSILYRGPLSSCNYACWYCPFAKHRENADELHRDEQALIRFVNWVERRSATTSVLFTPWGEALVRPWYQQALARLTQMPHVRRAAIQTNIACSLDWVENCVKDRLALWTTYHPSQVRRDRFVQRCLELDRRGVRFSVGVVGLKENLPEAEALRRELPARVYVWINAYKDQPDYYDEADIEHFEAIDPLFRINNIRHASAGKTCRAGHSVISVDGEGTMRRCHFIREPIGNIYDDDYESALIERTCTNRSCGCHIGYVHLDDLKLYDVFGEGVLERIPVSHDAIALLNKSATQP